MSAPIEKLLSRLDGVQGRAPTWRAVCPAHPTRHRSRTLKITERPDGGLLIKCFSGCSAPDVLLSIGLGMADLYPRRMHERERAGTLDPGAMLRQLDVDLQAAATLLAVSGGGRELSELQRAHLCRVAGKIRSARRACGLRDGSRHG